MSMQTTNNQSQSNTAKKNRKNKKLYESIDKNIDYAKTQLGDSSDIIVRKFDKSSTGTTNLAVMYINELSSSDLVNFIVTDLVQQSSDEDIKLSMIAYIKSLPLSGVRVEIIAEYHSFFQHILSGNILIMIEGENQCLSVQTNGGEKRGVEEPSSQTVVRGPKEGFTERLSTNISLLRMRIKTEHFRVHTKMVGEFTQTKIGVVYIEGIANPKIVKEVNQRLDKVNVDGIFDSGSLEEFIQDEPYTLFPTINNAERPDMVSLGLLEGRIGIIVDGSPFVLIVPALFTDFLETAEDYYHNFYISSLVRMVRYLAFFITTFAPALYIAITSFHHELLPVSLLISIASQHEGVPFPVFFEALIMEITFEILREAGIRMPRVVGPAISIVGALVLGEAAVEAGLVSPFIVIVVSITAISSFIAPVYNMGSTVRILRFIFMVLAITAGIYGIIMGVILLILHLCSIRSFGVPYMGPVAPYIKGSQKNILVRFPQWALNKRPSLISKSNTTKERNSKPTPKK